MADNKSIDFIEIIRDIRGKQLTTALAAEDTTCIYGDITSMYRSIDLIKDNINSLALIQDELEILANDITAFLSLYNDKLTLDSLYADKATFDSLYADKIKLDSLFADKITLDSIFSDKTKLDSLYADKVKLDSLFADKIQIDSVYANKTNIDTVSSSITNVNLVGASIGDINNVSGELINIGINADNIANIAIASSNIDSINTVANGANLANIIRVADDLNSLDVNGIADITIVANDLVKGIDSDIITVSESISNVNLTGASIGSVNTTAVSIGNVNIVANNIASVNTNAGSIDNINIVALNIDEVLLADTNAQIATQKALEAALSADEAEASAVLAANHIARLDNPHTVTKAQVGLGNLQNIDTTNATNITTGTLSADRLATSGAIAGTYKSVTVDTKGRVTSGTNPTTISGYGITDAYTKTEADLLLDIKAEINDDTPSLTEVYSSTKTQYMHNLQAEAIANLATAQCHIINSTTPALTLTTTHNVLPFSIHVDSTDTNIMTVNDAANTITFLKNASFNFLSHVLFSSTTSQARTVSFELINTSDNSILVVESNIIDIPSGTTEGIALNTLITVGRNGIPEAPLTMAIRAYSTGTGHIIQSFNSILASSSSYDVSTEAAGISFVPAGNISALNVQLALQELDSEKLASTSYTAADVLTKIKTVDGAGSGLDADLLDGQSSAYYATAASVSTIAGLDPVITLNGDATGSVTLTNLGSATLSVSIVDDSHNHVISNIDDLQTTLNAKAPLVSPALTGIPTAPTAVASTNTTQVATTAFVQEGINDSIAIYAETPSYGISWNETLDTYTRVGDSNYTRIQSKLRRCVLNSDAEVMYYLHPDNSTLKEDGTPANLTGADGNVMVEVPLTYLRYNYNTTSGTKHTWEISDLEVDVADGFEPHACFVRAGEVVKFRYYPAYLGTVYGNKLMSIGDVYPTTNRTRKQFRELAKANGEKFHTMDFLLYELITMFMIIEYGTMNIQSALGQGRTALTGGSWVNGSLIGINGLSNFYGNKSANMTYAGVATDTGADSSFMSYRGCENFFGNVCRMCDGINIRDRAVYINDDFNTYEDDVFGGDYKGIGVTCGSTSDYGRNLGNSSKGFFVIGVSGGSSNVGTTDYFSQALGNNLALVGGGAANALYSGPLFLSVANAASFSSALVGAGVSA